MTVVIMLIFVTAALYFQVGLDPVVFLGGAKWPFLMAVSFYYTLHRPIQIALVVAFVCGIMQDASSVGIPLGVSSLFFTAIALLVSRYQKTLVPEAFLTALFFGFLGSALMTLLQFVILRSCDRIDLGVLMGIFHVTGSAFLGGLSCIAFFPLARHIEVFAGSVDPKEDISEFDWSA